MLRIYVAGPYSAVGYCDKCRSDIYEAFCVHTITCPGFARHLADLNPDIKRGEITWDCDGDLPPAA